MALPLNSWLSLGKSSFVQNLLSRSMSLASISINSRMVTNFPAFLVLLFVIGVAQGLQVIGFYSQSCPAAESIVTAVVREAVRTNPRTAPILLRLHFHDCFVDGCDGSILLDSGNNPEKIAFAHAGVMGIDVIESAKSRLEAVCQGFVSCSDIVALAARDAISLANGPFYQIPTGRKDGRVSNADHASRMPGVDEPINVFKSKFSEKGLAEKELVLLTAGAHTMGTTACFFMQNRLYNFNSIAKSDPSINPKFLPKLKSICPHGGDVNARTSLDPMTNNTFDDQPFSNLKGGFAVLASDARLMEDSVTRGLVESYLNLKQEASFEKDFVDSILKLGAIGVKSGAQGEIRRKCNDMN